MSNHDSRNPRVYSGSINYEDKEGSYLEMAKRRILAPAKSEKPKHLKPEPQEKTILDLVEELELLCL